MVVEIAVLPVERAKQEAFESAARIALADVFPRANGFIRGELRHGVERPDRYVLLLEWQTIEDHIEGFVGSELFARWAELTDGLISGEPVVDHWESVA